MNTSNLFHSQESDSRIMIKKDKDEVNNWMDDLEYMNEELEYLLEIEDRILNNAALYEELQTLQKENTLNLRTLFRYNGAIKGALECDTVECDAFYLSKHERNRKLYLNHKKKYRNVKSKVLSNILLEAKH
ncbi:hypothetical protein DHD32_12720 [Arenibacter sp. TNZ]|uniref:hypothetical protein n=1 Tax=Arenibacter TaxID=178469 RepID=UPI000CD473D9|nr:MULTISPECIES: hypothetical protein [Arenibacter]MCM4172350.1 hypothetical protein [Arenibacter sp. TNZ]